MPALVAGIHEHRHQESGHYRWSWIAGTSPAMTGWGVNHYEAWYKFAMSRPRIAGVAAGVGMPRRLPYTVGWSPAQQVNEPMRSIFFFSLLAFALLSAPTGSDAQQRLLTIELNRMQPSQDGCRLSFMAVNRLGANLDRTALEIVIFDAGSIVSQMLLLDFGQLPNQKTKVVEFDLSLQCEEISRVLINDVAECAAADEQNMVEQCFNALRTSNRAEIEFGI
jgi:hypothetical protein